ncbi:MAG: 2-dehydropantoate 2-reductase [Firmicutes bacterium HGW-Firmicutes-2]|jgi:2-dehydropantoate 2-reductase|nr:MAG: 2-dehydropantoate 2-reductase [Firmicutes bacterium HGW-Firmicutes-2]
MAIKTVSIIGLGALGVLYGHHLAKNMPLENLRIIADADRIKRYKMDKIYCNHEEVDVNFMTPETPCSPSDLVIFAVKYKDLKDAIEAVKHQVGNQTILLSTLNGINSEREIGNIYGMEKMLYCVAQGMDALKIGNELTYSNQGILCFGDVEGGQPSEKTLEVAKFFESIGLPYEIENDMKHRMWGKFMTNVGVNQTIAYFEGDFSTIQKDGPKRKMMIAAMREVMTLAQYEGVYLSENDLEYWLKILDTLNPTGRPSTRQDMEAKRISEVDLFAGTVISLGKKHQIETPINQMLYDRIKYFESLF